MNIVPGNPPAPQTISHRLEEYYTDLVVSNYEGESTLFCFKKKHYDMTCHESFIKHHLDAEDENIRKNFKYIPQGHL